MKNLSGIQIKLIEDFIIILFVKNCQCKKILFLQLLFYNFKNYIENYISLVSLF